MTPTISVLLPVYNAERYLREAIDSILAQTFTDFELLLLNDGSTDSSAAIIETYTDPRIRNLPNDRNLGLTFTLNRGIDLARGRFIARMDSDDISYPERFSRQVELLESSDAAVVATVVDMMDSDGKPLPEWKDDRDCVEPVRIREFLLRDNCIAHPTVMARADMMKRYRYDPAQVEAEDYDLWLRLAADGLSIAKVAAPSLRYRVVGGSLTRKFRLNAFERLAHTKGRFIANRKAEGEMNEYCRRLEKIYRKDLLRGWIKKMLRR